MLHCKPWFRSIVPQLRQERKLSEHSDDFGFKCPTTKNQSQGWLSNFNGQILERDPKLSSESHFHPRWRDARPETESWLETAIKFSSALSLQKGELDPKKPGRTQRKSRRVAFEMAALKSSVVSNRNLECRRLSSCFQCTCTNGTLPNHQVADSGPSEKGQSRATFRFSYQYSDGLNS